MNLLLFVANLSSFVMFFAKSDECRYRALYQRCTWNLRSLREIFFDIWRPGSVRPVRVRPTIKWPEGDFRARPSFAEFRRFHHVGTVIGACVGAYDGAYSPSTISADVS